jgi:hypothetical protein
MNFHEGVVAACGLARSRSRAAAVLAAVATESGRGLGGCGSGRGLLVHAYAYLVDVRAHEAPVVLESDPSGSEEVSLGLCITSTSGTTGVCGGRKSQCGMCARCPGEVRLD